MLEQQMAARGVSLGSDGTVRSCIAAEQARQDNIFAGQGRGQLLTQVERGDTVTGGGCAAPTGCAWQPGRGSPGPEHFTPVSSWTRRGDLDLDTEARWLGAHCGN